METVTYRGRVYAHEDLGGGCSAYVHEDPKDQSFYILQDGEGEAVVPTVGATAALAKFFNREAFENAENPEAVEGIPDWTPDDTCTCLPLPDGPNDVCPVHGVEADPLAWDDQYNQKGA